MENLGSKARSSPGRSPNTIRVHRSKAFREARPEIPLDDPWDDLKQSSSELVLNGDGKFLGVRGFFDYLERKKYKLHVRVFLSRYRGYSLCSACNGTRCEWKRGK